MRRVAVVLSLATAFAAVAAFAVSATAVAASRVAAQPRHPVYLIYDGFVRNADGSLTLAYGYHNVNRVDVTVEREDNAFLTGAADRDQPTVFPCRGGSDSPACWSCPRRSTAGCSGRSASPVTSR